MSISYPRRKDGDGHNFLFQNENGIGQHLILRFEMATTSLSNKKVVNHHVFLRWQDDYIIILSHYYIGISGRRHVNIPPFKVRWRWPPIPKVRTGLATTWLFDYWVIILLHSYVIIFSYCYLIILRGCYISPPPFRVRWKWPPTPFWRKGIDDNVIIIGLEMATTYLFKDWPPHDYLILEWLYD